MAYQDQAELHDGAVASLVSLHACGTMPFPPVLPRQPQLHICGCTPPLFGLACTCGS